MEKTLHSEYGDIRNERADLKTVDLSEFMDRFSYTVPGSKNIASPPLQAAIYENNNVVQ